MVIMPIKFFDVIGLLGNWEGKNKTGTTTVYLLESIRSEGKLDSTSKVMKCFSSSNDDVLILSNGKKMHYTGLIFQDKIWLISLPFLKVCSGL